MKVFFNLYKPTFKRVELECVLSDTEGFCDLDDIEAEWGNHIHMRFDHPEVEGVVEIVIHVKG